MAEGRGCRVIKIVQIQFEVKTTCYKAFLLETSSRALYFIFQIAFLKLCGVKCKTLFFILFLYIKKKIQFFVYKGKNVFRNILETKCYPQLM